VRCALNRDLLAAGAIALAAHAAALVVLRGLPGPAREVAAPRPRTPIAVVLVGAPAMETIRQANDEAAAEPGSRTVAATPQPAPAEPADMPVERVAPPPGAPLGLEVLARAAPASAPPPATATDRARAPHRPAMLDTPALPVAAEPFAAPGALPDSIRAGRTTSIDPPAAVRNDPPRYPRVARQRGHEGTVDLRVHVLASGRSDAVEVKRSSGHASLDRAAVRAAKEWRFEPAWDGGRAVAMWIEIPVEFNLRGARAAGRP